MFDEHFERTFRRMSNLFFNRAGIFETPKGNQVNNYGPYYYGYQMTVGPDGKPQIKEWGNIRPASASRLPGTIDDTREHYVDEIINKEKKTLQLVTEIPGIEKSNIQVNVANNIVSIYAEHGDRKYSIKFPLKHKVNENSAKAKFTNGILDLTFALVEEKPKGKTVFVK